MIGNYVNIALRYLWKQRMFSIISIGGLGLGIAVSIMIMQFVIHEWSYDKFHTNGASIYRILSKSPQGITYPAFTARLAPQLAQENPDIKAFVRIYREWSSDIKNPEQPDLVNEETGFVFADPSFFSVFTFPLKYGSARHILDKPFSVVISERIAKKYFGDQNPIGKKISFNGQHILEVTGVAMNAPSNSTLNFDFVSSNETFKRINKFAFENLPNFETFLLIDRIESLPQIIKNIKPANQLIAALNFNEQDHYELERLQGLRLGTTYTYAEKAGTGLLYTLSGISLLILSLALFNYINLATAKATLRAKEVGVRKSIGANRLSLVIQFFIESALVTFFGFILGIILVLIFREPFNNLLGLTINSSFLTSKAFISMLVLLFASSTVLAGIYPALILSGFSPIKVLKGDYIGRNQGAKTRRLMMVVQFTVSATLIICSLIMHQQIRYMKNKDLGFNKDQVLNIKLSSNISSKSESFKKDVVSRTGIEGVSLSDTRFFKGHASIRFKTLLSRKATDLTILEVDADFIANLGLKWKVTIDNNSPVNAKRGRLVLNEAAVKLLDYTDKNVVGRSLLYEDGQEFGKVAGVVQDFNLNGPQTRIQPMVMNVRESTFPADGFRYIQLRLQPQDQVSERIASVEKIYREYDAESPFQYSFLDDDFQNAFLAQTRIVFLMQLFTAIAIVLACLGLFGLITFTCQTRSKEISIRKIMGASISNIFFLLSGNFLTLIMISVIIATPVGYYCMQNWLNNFAYRIEISWLTFATGGLASLIIALSTIVFHGLKAATENPVNSLRSE
jgi:putative ABC transport system permease protein